MCWERYGKDGALFSSRVSTQELFRLDFLQVAIHNSLISCVKKYDEYICVYTVSIVFFFVSQSRYVDVSSSGLFTLFSKKYFGSAPSSSASSAEDPWGRSTGAPLVFCT